MSAAAAVSAAVSVAAAAAQRQRRLRGCIVAGTGHAGGSADAEVSTHPIDDADAAVDAAVTVDAEPGDPEPTDYGARGPHEVLIEKNVGTTHRNSSVTNDTATCAAFVALVGADADPETIENLTSYPADMDRQL